MYLSIIWYSKCALRYCDLQIWISNPFTAEQLVLNHAICLVHLNLADHKLNTDKSEDKKICKQEIKTNLLILNLLRYNIIVR